MEFLVNDTPTDHSIRFANGAQYREGAGQTCAQCELGVVKP
jgi:hypothetical protein